MGHKRKYLIDKETKMLKFLLTLLGVSFIPLILHVIGFLSTNHSHERIVPLPQHVYVVLPIIISAALLVAYCIYILAKCIHKNGLECFYKKK